jgi:hypothetical protein
MGESPTKPGRIVLLFVTAIRIEPLGADEVVQRAKRAELLKKEAASAALPPHEVKFVTGPKQFAEGDEIVIDKVMCSSNEFKIGDKVVVQGRYRLTSIPEAQLALYLTHWEGDGPEHTQREQWDNVKRGSGAFERTYTIEFQGSLHLNFYDITANKGIGGFYFGTQQQVNDSAAWSLDTSQVVSPGHALEPPRDKEASPAPPAFKKEDQAAEGDRALILAEFAKLGGSIKEAYVDDDIDNVIRQNFGNDRAAFERDLAQKGQSLDQFRNLRREMMIISVLKARATKGITDPAAKKRAVDKWLIDLRRKSGLSAPEAAAKPDEEDTRQVDVTVWLAEFRHGKDEDVTKILFRAMSASADMPKAEVALPPDDVLKQMRLPPGTYAVSGVVTPAQLDILRGTLLKRREIKTNALPTITTTSGKAAIFKQDVDLAVEALPAIGPDGLTLDLNVAIKSADSTGLKGGRVVGGVTTSITLWDGQTVIMGGTVSEDEKSRLSQLIFITAKLKK